MTAIPDITRDVPIRTWFGVGGRADRFCLARSEDDLRLALREHPDLRLLGDGANLIVDDGGVGELVVALAGPDFTAIEIDPRSGRARAGTAAKLPALINRTADAGLAGLEILAGFPATVGGAVVMNAGGKDGDISAAVRRVHAIDRMGNAAVLDRADISFGYRTSGLSHLILTAVEFQLTPDDPAAVRERRMRMMEYKKTTQPLADNSAGCCFKNPTINRALEIHGGHDGRVEFRPGVRVSAGLLIDRAGCKGTRLGSARISDRHANFITADRGGKAGDVLALMDLAARRVLDEFGVALEPEVVIWRRSP